ncbi:MULTISPECIES: hypothetical protein [Staphylococcus]|nr:MULTISPECIES: hypothetical protein [Staphylococcus]MBE9428986.1 hypothetical protein [Staphylococcus epidermidis]MDU9351725.1 hypothetical protein [Staphylococcus warneri]
MALKATIGKYDYILGHLFMFQTINMNVKKKIGNKTNEQKGGKQYEE